MPQNLNAHRLLAATIVLATTCWCAANAVADRPAAPRAAIAAQCLVSPVHEVATPARETGPLVALPVVEGAEVVRGELLAQIDDDAARRRRFVAERELRAAQARALDDVEIRYAEASLAVADAEWRQALEINQRAPGSVPEMELRRLQLTRRRAELQVERSRLELQVAQSTAEVKQAEVEAAAAEIERRRIVAPWAGVVAAVSKRPGEWVAAGEPLCQIIALETLHVEGFLSAEQFDAGDLERRPAVVRFTLAGGRSVELPATVTYVSPVVKAGGYYRVRATASNRRERGHWLLRPGMTAELRVLVDEPPAPLPATAETAGPGA